MSECTDPLYESNCGLVIAQDLLDRGLLDFDTVVQSTGQIGVRVDPFSEAAFEGIKIERLFSMGVADMLDLGCLSCGSCVRVTKNFGQVSAMKLNSSPNDH